MYCPDKFADRLEVKRKVVIRDFLACGGSALLDEPALLISSDRSRLMLFIFSCSITSIVILRRTFLYMIFWGIDM